MKTKPPVTVWEGAPLLCLNISWPEFPRGGTEELGKYLRRQEMATLQEMQSFEVQAGQRGPAAVHSQADGKQGPDSISITQELCDPG